MTSKPRQRGGQAKPADTEPTDSTVDSPAVDSPADEPDTATAQGEQEQQADKPAAADSAGPVQRTAEATADTLQTAGEPVPDEVDKGMVRDETGLSPEVDANADAVTAPFGDDERNGKPLGIPVDTSGDLRRREGVVLTAAHGQDARNGHATGMAAEGQIGTQFGGNAQPGAKLAGSGVRGEQGVGTLDPDIGPDERPTYPSTTLTRSGPDAAPMEPEDVKYVTQPKLGDVKTSTDPTMAASAMPSMPGDDTVALVNGAGDEVKPSEFFEVPDGIQARSLRRVKHRVSEVHTVRHVKDASRRLLFTEGQLVPVDVAETLIRLHG